MADEPGVGQSRSERRSAFGGSRWIARGDRDGYRRPARVAVEIGPQSLRSVRPRGDLASLPGGNPGRRRDLFRHAFVRGSRAAHPGEDGGDPARIRHDRRRGNAGARGGDRQPHVLLHGNAPDQAVQRPQGRRIPVQAWHLHARRGRSSGRRARASSMPSRSPRAIPAR